MQQYTSLTYIYQSIYCSCRPPPQQFSRNTSTLVGRPISKLPFLFTCGFPSPILPFLTLLMACETSSYSQTLKHSWQQQPIRISREQGSSDDSQPFSNTSHQKSQEEAVHLPDKYFRLVSLLTALRMKPSTTSIFWCLRNADSRASLCLARYNSSFSNAGVSSSLPV